MNSISKEKKYVLVDFFDTVCFRSIHSHQIFCQWAKAMLKVYPLLNMAESELVKSRNDVIECLSNIYEEPPYKEVMKRLWTNIGGEKICDSDGFVIQSLKIDIAVELGCQYANKRMLNFLEKQKRTGKKIYIVSDFYLPRSSYDVFIKALKCENLFDGIYVSECLNKTKRKGTLYQHVLRDLNIKAEECVMIGDSRHADVKMAKTNGIEPFHYFPLYHKLWTNISKRLKLDFGNHIIRNKSSILYHHTLYEEYVIVLYYVIQKLYYEASVDGVRSLAFLSRGGYFLMKLFEEYQMLAVPEEKRISVRYCFNSRKVCLTAENDMTNRKLLTSYLNEFIDEGRLCIVDEGWYNHSQQAITNFAGIDTYGYYIGTRAKKPVTYGICERKGLLFDVNPSGKKSKFFGVFCSNCSMYEQILTAPHGSVSKYVEDKDGKVFPILKENEKEKWLYEHCIRDMQETMLLHFKGLTAWLMDKEIRKEQLARIVLRSLFFANKKRLHFMNLLDANRYENVTEGKVKSDKGVADVRISPIELLVHPDRYVGMFCKLQRKLTRNRLMMIVYYPIAACFYVYVRLLSRF